MSANDKTVSTGEIGQSGTLIFNGIITNEEYNRELVGKSALKIYDRMRRSDGTVAAAVRVCRLPIQSASWTMEAASDSAEDIKIADFVRQNLFNNENFEFSELLREVLSFFEFGHSVFELVWNPEYTYENTPFIGLSKVASRKQTSIQSWEIEGGKPGITQNTLTTGGVARIPMEKLLVFTFDKEGDNYEGISLLRPAYKHWYIIDSLYKIDAIRHERQGLGIVEVIHPDGASEEDIRKAEELARAARANEEANIRHGKDWTFEFMDMKAGTTSNPMESVAHHDAKIVKSVLAPFLNYGADKSGGNRALSADSSKLFILALEAAAKLVASGFNRQVVKRMVDMNFTTKNYPTLSFGKLSDDNVVELSEAVGKLVTANALTPDADMEQSLRVVLGLPDIPEDYRKDYSNRPTKTALPALPAPAEPTTKKKDSNGDGNLNANDALERARRARVDLIAATEAEYARI